MNLNQSPTHLIALLTSTHLEFTWNWQLSEYPYMCEIGITEKLVWSNWKQISAMSAD